MLKNWQSVLNYLRYPIDSSRRQSAIVLTLIAAGSVVVFLLTDPSLTASSRWLLAVLIAAVIGFAVREQRRRSGIKTELSMLVPSLTGLIAVCLGVPLTGHGSSPLLSIHFVAVSMFCAIFRRPVALALTGLAAVSLSIPLITHYDFHYVQRLLIEIPGLFGTCQFLCYTFEPLRLRAKENRYLSTLARATDILAKQDVSDILDTTGRQVIASTGADSCIVFLIDTESVLVPHAVQLSEQEYTLEEARIWQEQRIPIGEGMTGWVAERRIPILSGDSERHPAAQHIEGTAMEDASCIICPMMLDGKLIGVIRASRKGLNQFTDEDLHMLQVLAGQAATSVERSRLLEETKAMAMTDPLTGLYNRHYFNRNLEPTLVANGGGETLAVLMIDIFAFKHINDSYGHLVGDMALQVTAQLMRKSVRSTDIVVRYGGDEFVVVMPNTDLDQAEGVKHRIELAVEEWNVSDRQPFQPTISLNIGAESAPASEFQLILSRADEGMYAAKRSEERRRLITLEEQSQSVREQNTVQAVLALTKIQELKDPYTRGHAERARRWAVKVAEKLGLTNEEANDVGFGAVLHDVGKIVIPPEIIHKPGPLSADQVAIMRCHPQYGATIVGEVELLSRIKPLVLYHQERFDGDTAGKYPGYPTGLRGDDIPLGARIIAVVDAFDAMTSDRSYRKGMTSDEAVFELRRHAGSQFDPAVVNAFLLVLDQGGLYT